MITLVPASPIKECLSCYHFHRSMPVANGGQCRRRAPHLVLGSNTMGEWPSVAVNDRCGEYEVLWVEAAPGRGGRQPEPELA